MPETVKIKYVGPPDQQVVGVEGVPGTPEHGKTYDVSSKTAKALTSSSAMWEKADEKKKES